MWITRVATNTWKIWKNLENRTFGPKYLENLENGNFFREKNDLNLENQYFLFFAPNNAKNDYTKIYH
jgi:hypothetical protein